jgi:hypothetical protein
VADVFNRISTEIASLVPIAIESRAVDVIYVDTPFPEMCVIDDFREKGIVRQIPQTPKTTAKDLTEDAVYGMTDSANNKIVGQSFSITNRQITAGVVGIDVKMTLPALEASLGNLQAMFEQSSAAAVAEKMATDLFSRYTDASAAAPKNEIGTIGTDPDFALVLAGHQLLWDQACNDIVCIWGSGQLTAVINIPEFKEFRLLGRNAIEQRVDAKMGRLGGTPFGSSMYWSPKISKAGGAAGHAIITDKSAWGISIKAMPKVVINDQKLWTEERSVTMSVTLWYGTGGRVDTALGNTRMVEAVS